jgi:hypothetical protein
MILIADITFTTLGGKDRTEQLTIGANSMEFLFNNFLNAVKVSSFYRYIKDIKEVKMKFEIE